MNQNVNLQPGDITELNGKKVVVLACPDDNPACEVLHTREITKPTLDELRTLNKKAQTEDGLTEEDEIRISLANEDDMITVIGESLEFTVTGVSFTAEEKD